MAAGIGLSNIAKSQDLLKRIAFCLFALFLYRVGCFIPIPGLDPDVIAAIAKRGSSNGLLGMFDMFAGGALSRMTIFALNIMPYISSSIIMQLMTVMSPELARLKKDGGITGRAKINQYTRWLTVFIATIQAYAISSYLMSMTPSPVLIGGLFPFVSVPTLVGGTLFVVWLGDQITNKGVGNGTSLIIFAGIVASMPAEIGNLFVMGREGVVPVQTILFVMALSVFVMIFVVFMERAQRKIPIHYPQRRNMASGAYSGEGSHMPLKINPVGVMPPIFAYALMSLPITIANFFTPDSDSIFAEFLAYFRGGGVLFNAVLAALIVVFAFVYAAIVIDPDETAENLKKAGGFIPGVRPGKATSEYIDYVVTRLTCLGSAYLVLICMLPDFVFHHFGVRFLFGGTGLLIIVGVTMDTVTQIYTHAISHQYRGVLRKAMRRKQ